MAYTLKSNYQHYKLDFKKDTGLDADQNQELYLSYYQARCSDTSMQLLHFLLNEVANWHESKRVQIGGDVILKQILEELKKPKK